MRCSGVCRIQREAHPFPRRASVCLCGERRYNRRALGGYAFKKEDKEIYVAWAHSGKNATFNINKTGAGWSDTVVSYGSSAATITVAENAEVRLYDMYGKELIFRAP